MRLPVIAAAAILGLGLFCGRAEAGRMWYPTIDNPYCDIKTYLLRELPEQAMSMLDSNERPLIVVSAHTIKVDPAYGHFLMAHECCHHTLGHVRRFQGLGQVGPQPFFYIAPALKGMELDADCCAVKMLKFTREPDSIAAARKTMEDFGTTPTGAHYPTGIERAENIAACEAKE